MCSRLIEFVKFAGSKGSPLEREVKGLVEIDDEGHRWANDPRTPIRLAVVVDGLSKCVSEVTSGMNYCPYPDQVSSPLNDSWSCRRIGRNGAPGGTSKGTVLSETLESRINGPGSMGPSEVGGDGSVRDGILYTV